MKGKISVLLLFLLMSLLLVGCEDLSTFTTTGSETPTTTESSTPVTTTAPATGVTTTAPATGVTTTVPATGVTTTVPATTVSTGFFDRSLLVGAIIAMDGSGEMTEAEAEEQIGMMTMILGVSEDELYAMVLEAPTMISGLQTIETLADFQLWYAEAKTIMSKQMLTDAMMNVIQMMSAQVVDDPQTEYLQQEIDDTEDALADALVQLAAVRTAMVAYGNTNTTNGASVVAYYDAIVAREEANSTYYQAEDEYFYDRSWEEYDEYEQLEDHMWNYYYYLYDYVDTELANQAITNYNNLLGSFSTEKQAAYGALIELYEAYLMCQFATVPLAEEEIAGLQDTVTEEMVTSVLNDDYLSEYYNWSSEVNTYEWVLVELQYELEQAEAMLAFMELFVAYLGTVDGATTLKLVVIDLYDLADALIVNLDEEVFDLIFGMLFNYAPLGGDLLDEMSGIQLLLGYIDELSAILTTIQTEMDTEAIGHLSDLLKDVATIYVQSMDLPIAEENAMLAVFLPKIDEYLGIADEIFDELVGFLQTVDEDKIAAITAFVEMMIPEEEQDPVVFMSVHDQNEMFFVLVEAAKLAQALIGDESLDLSMIVDHLVTIYFDIEYDFQPDPEQVTLIRGLVIG
ncbi:MAG: hypothetical protein PHI01_02615, partial [Candidatus Izemoplasmatales bacterium]|nr:hypothetical protein [Candidatus Izemoplasmatales bacterium]